jgi:hypothetical protein
VTLARVESDDSEGSEGGAGEFPACSEAAPLTTGQGQQNQQQGNDQKSEEGPDGLGDEFEAELAALRAALTPANRVGGCLTTTDRVMMSLVLSRGDMM